VASPRAADCSICPVPRRGGPSHDAAEASGPHEPEFVSRCSRVLDTLNSELHSLQAEGLLRATTRRPRQRSCATAAGPRYSARSSRPSSSRPWSSPTSIGQVWNTYTGKDLTVTTNAGTFTGRVRADKFTFDGVWWGARVVQRSSVTGGLQACRPMRSLRLWLTVARCGTNGTTRSSRPGRVSGP
jgi:hypothetical protein